MTEQTNEIMNKTIWIETENKQMLSNQLQSTNDF